MTEIRGIKDLLLHRSELLVKMFLLKFNPVYLLKPEPDIGIDFLVGFRNRREGLNVFSIEVKGITGLKDSTIPVSTKTLKILADSNSPALLFFVDSKYDKLYYAWVEPTVLEHGGMDKKIRVKVREVDAEATKELENRFRGEYIVEKLAQK